MKKRDLETEINDFIEIWDYQQHLSFFKEIMPLFELYDVDEDDDWIQDQENCDAKEARTLRLIRTVYLISRLASFHAGKLCRVSHEFKDLWKRMEVEQKE